MDDIRNLPWCQFMEDALKGLVEFNPERIAIVAVSVDGSSATFWNECSPLELFGMAGALYADAMWMQIEHNGNQLKEIIDNVEDEENAED